MGIFSLTQEIKDTLGIGGLTQQVRATDGRGMNLLMYVARYADSVQVFTTALELVKDLTKQGVVEGPSQLRHWDTSGKNLLHHAAEGRTEEIFSKV